MAVEDGKPVTDILKMDLSAVTLCRQGMNQKAKFDLVSKRLDGQTPDPVGIAKSVVDDRISTMSDTNDTDDLEKAFRTVLDERLPEGDLATVEDVEKHVDARFEELTEKMDEEPPETVEEDEVPEGPEGAEAVDVESEETEKSASALVAEMKSTLPSDQWEAIKPIVKDCMGEDDLEVVDGDADPDAEEEFTEDDPLADFEGKSVDDLDPDEAETVAKSLLEKAGGVSPSPGSAPGETEPAHVETQPEGTDAESIAKTAEEDPVLAGMMTPDGEYRI
jgi:hypothetical protein